jgi:hypothetical protein
MSSIENSRKDLKIDGYVHPTEKLNTSYNPYKTFNTDNKKSDYETAKTKSGYATFTDKESVSKQSNLCPECGIEAMYICSCELKDKQCPKGHVWYVNKSGNVINKDPH